MPDRLEGRLRWLFGAAVVVVVARGVLVLLAALGSREALPDATAFLADGGVAPVASAGPELDAAVSALVLALAALLAWSPRRFAHLMPVLALGAFAAALALLVDGAWLGGAVALGCAAVAALAWLRLWLAPRPSIATLARDEDLLHALLDGLVPMDGAFALGANDAALRDDVTRTFAARHRRGGVWLRLALRVLDARSVLAHRRGFARLDDASREALLADLERSRVRALRRFGDELRGVVLTRVYESQRVHEQIGHEHGWVQARIDAGPNADAIRERRAEATRAALAALEAALAEEQGGAAASNDGAEPAPLALREADVDVDADAPAAHERDERRPPDHVPFDRPWTLGVQSNPRSPALGSPVLRVVRTLGPTRP